MATTDTLSSEDMDFLAKCEEELKDRFTDKDEEFMKVFNSDASDPPIVNPWWVSNISGRRNDRRHNRSQHTPYDRPSGGGDYRNRGPYDNRDRGRNNYDNRGYNDRGYESRRHTGYGHQSRY